jgi:hypothetical protein
MLIHPSLFLHAIIMSRYQVQYIPCTASSQDRLSLTPSQFLISRRMLLYSTLYIPTFTSYAMNTVSAAFMPPLVGIVDCFAARAPSSRCRNNRISYIEASKVLHMGTPISCSMMMISTCFPTYIPNKCAMVEVATNPKGYCVHAGELLKRYAPDKN